MYSLAPYCEILQRGDILHLAFGSIGMTFDTEREKDLVFDILKNLHSPERFASFLRANDKNEDLLAVVHSMIDHRILVRSDFIPSDNRHHREQLYFLLAGGVPSDVTSRLFKKSVLIVGCGGIGCLAAYTLVTAGIGKLVLMDDDVVELHNISRQFAYSETDIGGKKVNLLKDQLLARNSAASISAIDEKAVFHDSESNVPEVDFVILAADQPGIVPKANRTLVKRGTPFLHVCYINDIAAWGPLVIPGETGCWACQTHIGLPEAPDSSERTDIMQNINRQYVCPVISCVSNTAVALAMLDVIRFLGQFATPASINKRIGLWTHDLHFEYQDFSRSKSCPDCSF